MTCKGDKNRVLDVDAREIMEVRECVERGRGRGRGNVPGSCFVATSVSTELFKLTMP